MRYFLLLTLALCAAGCHSTKKPTRTDTHTSGVAAITSDDCLGNIVQDCINVFEAENKNATLLPVFTSETEAINLLLHDSIRFAVIARNLTAAEIQTIKTRNKQLSPRVQKLAVDGIAIIVHKNNADTLISVKTLSEIMTGTTTSWQALNPVSKLGKIVVVFDDMNSSTVRYIRDSVCGGTALSDNLYSTGNNLATLDYVARTPNSMGIIGVNWISNPHDTSQLSFNQKIRVVSLSRSHPATSANSYKPYPAYLHLREYPLTRNVYLALTDLRGTLPAGFAHFMLGERGQRIILKSGLVPATAPLRTIQIKQ
jgi:phosphate transport system substrate-binding protein